MRIRYALTLPGPVAPEAAEKWRSWLAKPGWKDVILTDDVKIEAIEPRPSMSPARVSVARARGR